MLTHLMTSWYLNTWKVKIWLHQEREELSKWNKKYFSLFHKCSLLNIQNKLAKMQRAQPLTWVVPGVRGFHYFIVTSIATLGVEWPTPCNPILCQQCFPAFNFQFISHVFQPCLHGAAPRVTTNYNCLVYLSWPCVWLFFQKNICKSASSLMPCKVEKHTFAIYWAL